MEIKLKGRVIPRDEKGDAHFVTLKGPECAPPELLVGERLQAGVLEVFTESEVVELVNRALYQLEYQAEAHRKRGQRERDRMKVLREEMKKQGIDPKKAMVDKQLKGE